MSEEDTEGRYQCECCLAYKDDCETKQPIICDDCMDKLAMFDITLRDKRQLVKGIRDAIKYLEKGLYSSAGGCLVAVLILCDIKPEKNKEV